MTGWSIISEGTYRFRNVIQRKTEGQCDVRYVDRDMLMRYHWGLGIGHKYSWDAPEAEGYNGAHSGSFGIAASNGENSVGGAEEACRERDSDESALVENPNMVVDDSLAVEDVVDDTQESEPEDFSEHYLDDGMEDLENEDLGDEDSEGDY